MADAIFISVAANGHATPDLDQVYLSFYGPRGGSRTTQTVTTEAAAKLRDDLVHKLGGGLHGDMLAALSIAQEALLAAASDVLDNPDRKDGQYARLMSAKEHVERAIAKAKPPAQADSEQTTKRYAHLIDGPAKAALNLIADNMTTALAEEKKQ